MHLWSLPGGVCRTEWSQQTSRRPPAATPAISCALCSCQGLCCLGSSQRWSVADGLELGRPRPAQASPRGSLCSGAPVPAETSSELHCGLSSCSLMVLLSLLPSQASDLHPGLMLSRLLPRPPLLPHSEALAHLTLSGHTFLLRFSLANGRSWGSIRRPKNFQHPLPPCLSYSPKPSPNRLPSLPGASVP